MSDSSEDHVRADAQRAALRRVAELEAQNARLLAERMRARAEVDRLWDSPLDGHEQFGVIELAGTARIGLGRAAGQLADGTALVTELTGTLAALEAGELFEPTAMLMLQLTRNCSAAVTIETERRVLPVIAGMNTSDARRIIKETIPQVEADLNPDATQERLDLAAEQARVWTRELPDGMVELGACIDVLSGKRWSLDFDELVRAQRIADKRMGIVRTAEQRRAAVFAQLPSRLLALIRAIQQGQIGDLLDLAQGDPALAGALAENLPALQALADQAPAPAPAEVDAPTDAMDDIVADPATADQNAGWPDWPWDTENPASAQAEETPPAAADDEPDDRPGAELCPDPPPGPAPDRAPDPGGDPDPPPEPEPPGAWTRDLMQQLVVQALMLPVKDPRMLLVHSPMSTLAGVDNRTGSIDGTGTVIPAHEIRLMAPTMTWRRLVCDPDSGNPLGIDPVLIEPVPIDPVRRDAAEAGLDPTLIGASPHFSRLEQLLEPILLIDQAENAHDPSAALRELVLLRDQRCIGIGCSLPAWRCHLDHEIPYPQGPTAAFDLSAKSARCHRAKHDGWTVTRPHEGPDSRTITWTSPLGHSYTRPSRWATIENRVHSTQPPD
jgi:hypothetical protein